MRSETVRERMVMRHILIDPKVAVARGATTEGNDLSVKRHVY
jgi:hypothetical protein